MPPDHAAPDDEPVAQPVPGSKRPPRGELRDAARAGRRTAGRRRGVVSTQDTLAPLLAMVPGLRLMVGMVIAAVVILGLYVGRDVLLPVALAALLGFLLDPAVSRLKRWGMPRVLSVALVMVLALGALGAGAIYVGNQVTSLSAELPTYQNTIRQKLRHVKPYFNGPGVWDGAVKVLNTVETEISQGDARARRVQKVEVQEPAVKPIQKALELLSKVAEPLATTGIVFLFVVLILLDRSGLQDRLLRLMGPNTHMASDALDDAATRIGQYLRMQLFVNLSYGVPMALGLWWIGVPGAILWGILAAVLRFVPYIGPMASAVFPLTLAFAVDPGWSLLLWTLALILVLELISNNVIEPWLYGASTGLSTLSIILAATFWTALWGPVGLILSTPLTVCLLVLGRYIPGMGFLEILLGSQAVFDPPEKLLQRLWRGDVDQAIDVASENIDEALPPKPSQHEQALAVTQFYDQVAVPALLIAAQQYRHAASPPQRQRLSEAVAMLLSGLQRHYRPAALPQVGEGQPPLDSMVCVGMQWDIDRHAATMAAHALRLHGVDSSTRAVSIDTVLREGDLALYDGVRNLCICSFHPNPIGKLSQICESLHRRCPQLRITVMLLGGPGRAPLRSETLGGMQADNAVYQISGLTALVVEQRPLDAEAD
ncbi:AI-2E family transporter [Comamonas sp. JUb58]|uniref:AI-2E family transporter n=1 Tax=Comamonas sp. JUb58 TaxID=2485114 RepID=UPI0010D209C7|nr:AI-2E family transporter [Comamonas sp. JUb58]TDS70634.1 putative PurR-regulated permease PerM [Comamonas sp. JUb58]